MKNFSSYFRACVVLIEGYKLYTSAVIKNIYLFVPFVFGNTKSSNSFINLTGLYITYGTFYTILFSLKDKTWLKGSVIQFIVDVIGLLLNLFYLWILVIP